MWPTLIPILGNLLEKIIPDPQAQADAKIKMLQMAQNGELEQLHADTQLALAQMDVNKAEASTDLFRGGWRPATGWVCAIGLLYQFLLRPILPWIVISCGGHVPALPEIDMGTLMILLTGMLGLGGLRTTEKIRGVS